MAESREEIRRLADELRPTVERLREPVAEVVRRITRGETEYDVADRVLAVVAPALAEKIEAGQRAAADTERYDRIQRARAGEAQRLRGEVVVALRQRNEAWAAIRDIERHATPVGLPSAGDPEGLPHHYAVTVGALHRALGKASTAEPCEVERARLRDELSQALRDRDDARFELHKIRNRDLAGINLECASEWCTHLAIDLVDLAEHSKQCHPTAAPDRGGVS